MCVCVCVFMCVCAFYKYINSYTSSKSLLLEYIDLDYNKSTLSATVILSDEK